MRFPAKKRWHSLPPVGLSWDSLPPPAESVRTDGRTDVRTDGRSRDYYVTTKISRIDRLPNLLSNGAPLAGFARRLRYELIKVNEFVSKVLKNGISHKVASIIVN